MFTFKPPSVDKTLYTSCFARLKKTRSRGKIAYILSSWLPKHKGFARRYACESCYGFRVTSEVTSSKGDSRLVVNDGCLLVHRVCCTNTSEGNVVRLDTIKDTKHYCQFSKDQSSHLVYLNICI